ncbi:alpha/beta hydrolase [Adhaeretor mobilis]|nr:alpha/beta hydrolase [Adhaeretor mobilis]
MKARNQTAAMLQMTLFVGGLLLSVSFASAADPELDAALEPTLRDVLYGDSPRHKLHFWKADSARPTALAFHIHGGGWNGGERLNRNLISVLPGLLKAKISVVSVEYRLIRHAVKEGVDPPVKAPLYDCAHALQFVRSKANEWNLDPKRVAAFGGSAGGCTSLWLAFHDDLADPCSEDPIARLSTRPNFAVGLRAQTTLDPMQMKKWMPNGFYGGHAFGIINPGKENREKSIKAFLASRDQMLSTINEYSPYALASSDDPPVYLYYHVKPAMGKDTKDPTHSSNYGVKLHEHLQSLGVKSELVYPGAPDIIHATIEECLVSRLK